MDRRLEQLRLRNKVGVEDADEIAPRRRQARLERAGFVADAIRPMDQLDIEAALRQPSDARAREGAGLIGGIVQHLDLQTLARIIEFAD